MNPTQTLKIQMTTPIDFNSDILDIDGHQYDRRKNEFEVIVVGNTVTISLYSNKVVDVQDNDLIVNGKPAKLISPFDFDVPNIAAPMQFNEGKLLLALARVTERLEASGLQTNANVITDLERRKEALYEEKKAILTKAQQQAEAAKAAKNTQDVWGWVSKGLMLFGAVVGVVAAGLLIPVSGGAAAVLCGFAVMGLVSATLSLVDDINKSKNPDWKESDSVQLSNAIKQGFKANYKENYRKEHGKEADEAQAEAEGKMWSMAAILLVVADPAIAGEVASGFEQDRVAKQRGCAIKDLSPEEQKGIAEMSGWVTVGVSIAIGVLEMACSAGAGAASLSKKVLDTGVRVIKGTEKMKKLGNGVKVIKGSISKNSDPVSCTIGVVKSSNGVTVEKGASYLMRPLETSKKVAFASSVVQGTVGVAQGGTSIGEGSAQLQVAQAEYRKDMCEAENKENKAEMDYEVSRCDDIFEDYEKLCASVRNAWEVPILMLKELAESGKTFNKNMVPTATV